MKTTFVTLIGALAIWAGVARSQEAGAKPDMHAMMAGQHAAMMASMTASNRKLVAERKQMTSMMSMHAGMMNTMMQKKAEDEHHK